MKKSDDFIMSFTTKKLKMVYQYIAPYIFCGDIEFEKVVQRQQAHFVVINASVNLDVFKKFLCEPQIEDIIKYYVSYVFLKKVYVVTKKSEMVSEDDIINFFIQTIEEHFSEISDDDAIIAIRIYFSVLFSIANNLIEDSSEFISFRDEDDLKSLCIQLISKINYILNSSFMPSRKNYEMIKNNYMKALKDYYSTDHIYMVDEFRFNKFYVPPQLIKNEEKFQISIDHPRSTATRFWMHRYSWTNIFDEDDIVYVVGGAGYGKSLFLKNLINNTQNLNVDNINNYLIIYCDLKSYYSGNKGDAKPVSDFFVESMVSNLGIDDITNDFVNYYLKLGRCLILLDALDEVPQGKRESLHKKILNFLRSNSPYNKVCITSRDRGFIPQKNIEVFTICALSEEEIDQYIDNMINLKTFKKANKGIFMEQAKSLINKGFLNSFLALSLLVSIFKAEKIPKNKVDLYNKCFSYIAKERELQKNTGADYNSNVEYLMKESTFISLAQLAAPNNSDVERKDIEECLTELYYKKFGDLVTTEQTVNQFLDFCSNRTEVFVPASSDDKFKFFHRSFFEYFYSKFILRETNVEKIYNLMTQFDIDSEVFELVVAILKEENEEKYQELIEYIFNKTEDELKQHEEKWFGFEVLTICMQVIDDIFFINKYYALIINYHEKISNREEAFVNEGFICQWIDKVIENNQEKQDEFFAVFENACVYNILLEFRRVWRAGFSDPYFENKAENIDRDPLPFAVFRSRFYVNQYSCYNKLLDLLKRSMNENMNTLWNKVSPSKRERRHKIFFKQGYDFCKKYLQYMDSETYNQ